MASSMEESGEFTMLVDLGQWYYLFIFSSYCFCTHHNLASCMAAIF